MRTVTVALGSLIVGACGGFLFGNHTSTRLQPVLAQSQPMSVVDVAAVPQVPPLRGISFQNGSDMFRNKGLQLDGQEISNTVFDNVTFVYGGGAFKLERVEFRGPMRVQLVGAAANTAQFLAFMNSLPHPPAQPGPPPRQAITREASNSGDITTSLVSVFGQ